MGKKEERCLLIVWANCKNRLELAICRSDDRMVEGGEGRERERRGQREKRKRREVGREEKRGRGKERKRGKEKRDRGEGGRMGRERRISCFFSTPSCPKS